MHHPYVLAVIAALLVLASLAPFDVWPAAWVGLALLFSLCVLNPPRRVAAISTVFGCVFFGVGLFWSAVALLRIAVVPAPAAIGMAAFLIVGSMAQLTLGAVVIAAWRAPPLAVRLTLVAPAIWAGVEWVRGVTLWGLPWLYVGYGQQDGPLGGLAPIAGANSVSLAAAVLSGFIALALFDRRAAFVRWLPGALAVAVIGFMAGLVTWTEPLGEPLKVAIVQPDIRAEKRFELNELQPQLDLLAKMTLDALAHEARVVFWPETAIPARIDQVEPFLAGLRDAIAPRGAEVVTGIVSRERVAGGWQYYNSAITSSEPRQEYRKRRLLPFTEYLPDFLPEEWRRVRHADATGILSPGPQDEGVLRFQNIAAGVTICWETTYASVVNSVPGVQLLVSLSNDDWFRSTSMPEYALEIARMRAREAGLDMVRAANSGISALIAGDGRITARAPPLERTTLRGTVQPRTGLTPYVRFGDIPLWVTIALMLTCSVSTGLAAEMRRRRNDRKVIA